MHNFYLKSLTTILATFLLLPYAHGQAWTIYNTANSGLPYNNATCVLPDGQGGVWIGTDYRLAHFDGNSTWEIYDTNNSGLPDNAIRSLMLDDVGNLWVGTFLGGLAKYDGSNWTVFDLSNSGLEDNFIRSMLIDQNGIIWIGTTGGLHRYDAANNDWQVFNIFNSPLLSGNIPCLALDANNVLWIGTINGGLARLENGNFTIYDADNSLLNDNTILQIHIDANQNKWLSTPAGGLNILDNAGVWFLYITLNSGICDNSINSVAELDGTFYIGTAVGGICTFNFWSNYHSGNTPMPGDDVNCIVVDDDALWLSVEELGIVKFIPSLFTDVNDVPALPAIKVYPNPATDFLSIETPVNTTARLYDLNGRLQIEKENLTDHDLLNIQHLPKGVYFLELKIGEQRFIRKIVKMS